MNIAILAVLIVIALVLVLILIQGRLNARRSRTTSALVLLDASVHKMVDDVMSSVEHAADISAVLKLMQDLKDHPDALELIKSYPKTVQAAALMHFCNSLGSASQQAHKALEDALKQYDSQGPTVRAARQKVDDIHAMLDTAVDASRRLNITAVS